MTTLSNHATTFFKALQIVYLFTISNFVYSQSYRPNVIPPSPEVASLGKFLEVPVSYYTGLPNITVPIHVLKHGDLQVPVSLNYHAGGVKVEEISSWVGIGWALSTGGSVSRVVYGNVDEHEPGSLAQGMLSLINEGFTYYELNNYNNTGLGRYQTMKDVSAGCYDAEPDLFFINVNGISGTFSFDWSGNIVVNSNKKIKVDLIWENGFNTGIKGWDVIGDDGTRYKFREIERSATSSNLCYLDQPMNNITSWHLSEMEDVNGQKKINFLYEPYILNQEIRNSESYSHLISGHTNCPGTLSGTFSGVNSTIGVNGNRLKSIQTGDGKFKMEFKTGNSRTDVTGSQLFTLGEIWVLYDNEPIKKFRLGHDYSTNRLTLRSVQQYFGLETADTYQFFYSGALPPRDSKNIDHWGYANNAANTTLVPAASVGSTHYAGADRSANLANAKSGSLVKIVFPTGSERVLEFELNDYSYVGSASVSANNEYTQIQHAEDAQAYGSGCSGTITNVDEEVFQIIKHNSMIPVPVQVSTSFQLYTDPYFGAGLDPKAQILDLNNNVLFTFDKQTPPVNFIQLLPGTYKLRAEATWGDCGGAVDVASISLSYSNDSQELITTKKSGGLRIKSIKDYEVGVTQPIQEYHFSYLMPDGKSSGAVYGEPEYLYSHMQNSIAVFYLPGTQGNPPVAFEIDCANQVRLARNPAVFGDTQGGHVGYQKVTVSTGSGQNNGITEYFYTSPFSHPHQVFANPPFPPSENFSFHTGQLTEKRSFDKFGTLLSKQINEYQSEFESIPALKLQFKGGVYLSEYHFYKGNHTRVFGHTQLVKSTEVQYANGLELESRTDYIYDGNLQNLIEKVGFSTAKTFKEKYYYPLDFIAPSSDLVELIDRNVVGTPIEIVNEITSNSYSSTTGALFKDFKFDLGDSTIFIGNVKQLNLPGGVTNFNPSSSHSSGQLDSRYENQVEFTKYDNNTGNILSYRLNDGVDVSLQWGYSDHFVIAEVKGANPEQIFCTSFEEDGTTGDAKTGVRYFAGSSYTIPLEKRPTGSDLKMSYWYYDGSWKFQSETTYNATIVKANTTKYDEVRVYPKGAMITTYTYFPGIGVASVTDANNQTKKYSYDSMGRLKSIMDHLGNVLSQHTYNYRSGE